MGLGRQQNKRKAPARRFPHHLELSVLPAGGRVYFHQPGWPEPLIA
jgi:hypothetical protein